MASDRHPLSKTGWHLTSGWHLAVISSASEPMNSLELLWAFFPACLCSVFIAVNKAILLWVYLGFGASWGNAHHLIALSPKDKDVDWAPICLNVLLVPSGIMTWCSKEKYQDLLNQWSHRVSLMLRLRAPLPPPRGLLLPVELKAALAHVLSYGPLPLFCSLFPCYPSPFLSTVSLPSFYVTPCCRDFKLILKICRNKILHPFCTQHEIFTTCPGPAVPFYILSSLHLPFIIHNMAIPVWGF